jgi:hypothetical protein
MDPIAAFSPVCASEVTSCTPCRPRAFSERRKAVQNGPDSLSPTSNPTTSRRPSVLIPVAITTAWAVTRLPRPRRSPPVRALQNVASTNTYGNAMSARDRSRNAATSTSRSERIRLTSLLLMPLSAPSAATRSSTLRVEVPVT